MYILRPFLFLLNPEIAHEFATKFLCFLTKIPFLKNGINKYYKTKNHPVKVANLIFQNSVGLAAGFDKNAKMIDFLSVLGFGFIEIGTVTPQEQKGNPKPRLFRLKKDQALINRMGFNNEGLLQVVERLKKRKKDNIIIGANIGKNKNTPIQQAVDDYLQCFNTLFKYVDYFTINISSPNTPNLRSLQNKEPLRKLLQVLQKENHGTKPIFLKIAPDLNEKQLDDIIEIAIETKIQGIIATNTTIARNQLKTNKKIIDNIGEGGLSGKPLSEHATQIIKYIQSKSAGKLEIIGVGGISNPEDAIEKIKAGAKLVQIYTGLIYEGPNLIKKINRALYNHFNK